MSGNSARDICRNMELSAKAQAQLHDNPSFAVFMERLIEAECYSDAIQIWARWMTLPHAVWWGCLCCWHGVRMQPPEPDDMALRSVLDWLREPTDDNRRACGAAAAKCKPSSTPGTLAQAAFWSKGSVLPPHLPTTEAPPGLSAQAVAAAIITVAESDGERVSATYRMFINLARDVVAEANRLD